MGGGHFLQYYLQSRDVRYSNTTGIRVLAVNVYHAIDSIITHNIGISTLSFRTWLMFLCIVLYLDFRHRRYGAKIAFRAGS